MMSLTCDWCAKKLGISSNLGENINILCQNGYWLFQTCSNKTSIIFFKQTNISAVIYGLVATKIDCLKVASLSFPHM